MRVISVDLCGVQMGKVYVYEGEPQVKVITKPDTDASLMFIDQLQFACNIIKEDTAEAEPSGDLHPHHIALDFGLALLIKFNENRFLKDNTKKRKSVNASVEDISSWMQLIYGKHKNFITLPKCLMYTRAELVDGGNTVRALFA